VPPWANKNAGFSPWDAPSDPKGIFETRSNTIFLQCDWRNRALRLLLLYFH
jgi:hypothetical protein